MPPPSGLRGVSSAITTVFGLAIPWNRAAWFGSRRRCRALAPRPTRSGRRQQLLPAHTRNHDAAGKGPSGTINDEHALSCDEKPIDLLLGCGRLRASTARRGNSRWVSADRAERSSSNRSRTSRQKTKYGSSLGPCRSLPREGRSQRDLALPSSVDLVTRRMSMRPAG